MKARVRSMRSWVTLALMLLTSLFLFESMSLSSVAGRIPRFIIATTLLLLIIQQLIDLKLIGKASDTRQRVDESQARTNAELTERRMQWQRFGLSVLWIASLCVLVGLLGLITGPVLFNLVWLRFSKSESWRVSVAYSIILALIVGIVFKAILGVPLYNGLVGEMLF